MANLVISDAIAGRLKQIAEQENKPVDAVLEAMIERYDQRTSLSSQHAIYTPLGGEDTAREMLHYLSRKRQHEIWSPQATEKGIATLYQAIEDDKKNQDDEDISI